MSKHKPQPTPTPNTPPLKDEKPTLGGAARALLESKGIDPESVPLAEDVPAEKPLTAEAATETLLSVITQRRDAVKRDGETPLQARDRAIGPASRHATLAKLVDIDMGSPEANAHHLEWTFHGVLRALKELGRDDKMNPAGAVEQLVREHRDMATALQPAFDALGPKANTRGILMSHVAGSGPDYDTGGQYQVTLVSVEDGAVKLSPLVDLGPKGTPSPVMSFGVAADHVLKRMEDFLRPKAHRS